jgi:nucleoside-diphosphate-sugar epimerase
MVQENKKSMKIVLIGHRGYIGIGLNHYLNKNHNVIGWDKEEDIHKLTRDFLDENKIDAIINLAVIDARGSLNYQINTVTEHVTVNGARHLANILSGSEISWFQLSTREVFGPVYGPDDVILSDSGYQPKFLVNEDFPFAPTNFYGKSKLVAEYISESHPKSNIIRLTTGYTDFDNPIGGWIKGLVNGVVNNGEVTLARGGLQFRDPLHTDDLGRLIEQMYVNKIYGQKINAGGGAENLLSLNEFVKLVDPNVKVISSDGGDYGFAFDISKAFKLVGWKPEVLLRDKVPIISENIRTGNTGISKN